MSPLVAIVIIGSVGMVVIGAVIIVAILASTKTGHVPRHSHDWEVEYHPKEDRE